MISLQIEDIKSFMNKLLLKPDFDAFLLVEGTVTTCNTFHIDGEIKPGYYTTEEEEALGLLGRRFSRWQELRPFCLDLIKGKRTPLNFRFTFKLSGENTEKLLEQTGSAFSPQDISGLFLNVRYDSSGLFCTTATALTLFTMDKSLEHSWDQMVQKFLLRQEVSFTLL